MFVEAFGKKRSTDAKKRQKAITPSRTPSRTPCPHPVPVLCVRACTLLLPAHSSHAPRVASLHRRLQDPLFDETLFLEGKELSEEELNAGQIKERVAHRIAA